MTRDPSREPHEPWESLAAGHALNALEPEDEHAFLDHLRGCDRCKTDLEAYEGVGAAMAYAAPPAEPPAGLGRRIAEAAAGERPPLPAIPLFRERRRRPRATTSLLATAAALVLLVVLGAWNVVLRADGRTKTEAIARRDAALRCLSASGTAKARLTSQGTERAQACVGEGTAYVFVDRLAPNDTATNVYVLWWADASREMHAVAPFDVTKGSGLFALPLTVAPADVKAMAISLEQGRHAPATPSSPVAIGSVSP